MPEPTAATGPWLELVECARWSPSPHNVQPWRVRIVSPSEVELLYEPRRLLPDTDPTSAFTFAGFGMFIECLDVAAGARGLSVEARFVTDRLDSKAAGPTLLAKLRLVPATRSPRFDPALVLQRRTSRRAYDGGPVPPRVLEACKALAAEEGNTLHWSEDPGLVDWMLRLNRDTLFLDMADDKARNEVGSWLRFSPRQARATKDGLWARCLGFPGTLLRTFFRHRGLFEMPGLRGPLRRLYLRSTRGTRTVAWLAGPFATRDEAVATGRMLQRIWLLLTREGLFLHPFGSIITNAEANARLQARIATDPAEGTLWLAVRIGHSRLPPRSLRLDAQEILM